MQFVRVLLSVLLQLGPRRLLMLSLVGIAVFSMFSVGTYYLNRPARETLYTGLSADDVSRIGATLADAGISFDVSVDGQSVLVEYGRTAQARMILAEKGLPKSDKSGYELFDNMGSLGLTSFMQQVTRVRALEGELARTIQLLDGVRSARVHLGQRDDGIFKSKAEQASASVVIQTDGNVKESLPGSVRQIVAAAIPGLKSESVTVLSTDGKILAASADTSGSDVDRMLDLEQKITNDIQQRVERAVSAIVGNSNVRVSVTAKLNTDRKQVTETNFDPESRVERSLKTTKETDENQNSANSDAVSVAQNIPQEPGAPSGGEVSREKKERKEELANYEMNSKQTAVESAGYAIEKISLAVLLNKQSVLKAQGTTPDEAKLGEQVSELEALVRSAVGFDEKRGDTVKIMLADFVVEELPALEEEQSAAVRVLNDNLGTIINSVSLLISFVLIIVLGLRPMVKAILDAPVRAAVPQIGSDGSNFAGGLQSLPGSNGTGIGQQRNSATDKLNKVVEIDMERAAHVLKQWLEKPRAEPS